MTVSPMASRLQRLQLVEQGRVLLHGVQECEAGQRRVLAGDALDVAEVQRVVVVPGFLRGRDRSDLQHSWCGHSLCYRG